MEASRKRDPEQAQEAVSQDIFIGGKALLEKFRV
jgi:hypothetical protein